LTPAVDLPKPMQNLPRLLLLSFFPLPTPLFPKLKPSSIFNFLLLLLLQISLFDLIFYFIGNFWGKKLGERVWRRGRRGFIKERRPLNGFIYPTKGVLFVRMFVLKKRKEKEKHRTGI